jgi:Zn/Cd-binding protein ZinT
MKKRNGFVSNSSSSSFVIMWKGNLRKGLEEAFTIPTGYPVKLDTKEIVKTFMSNIDHEKGMTVKDIEQYFGEDYNEDPTESPEVTKYKNLKKEGYSISFGSFSDEGNSGIETFLCDSEIKWDKENLKIEKESGY